MTTTISAAALKTLLESEELYAVVDVRDWGEFTLEQIPGTSSVPRGHIEKYVPVLIPTKDVRVVLYCDNGQRSARAATTLKTLGYSNERMAKYLKDEEALGEKYQARTARA